jgi:hypothetical protein
MREDIVHILYKNLPLGTSIYAMRIITDEIMDIFQEDDLRQATNYSRLETLAIFGMNLPEIKKMRDFAISRGYEFPKEKKVCKLCGHEE